MTILKFAPFSATIHPTFWQELSSLKIDSLQLSDEAVPMHARYAAGKTIMDRQTGNSVSLGSVMNLDAASLRSDTDPTHSALTFASSSTIRARGILKNFNTIEDFKNANKQEIFDHELQSIWQAITAQHEPEEVLTHFLLLTFADLKKYKFFYWFAYPALVTNPSWEIRSDQETAWKPINVVLKTQTYRTAAAWLQQNPGLGFFLLKASGPVGPQCGRITNYVSFFDGVVEEDCYVGFIDPSGSPQTPGWPLRNLLTYLHARFQLEKVKIICWKDDVSSTDTGLSPDLAKSMVGEVYLPMAQTNNSPTLEVGGRSTCVSARADNPELPAGVGWERNSQGKLAPKVADLGPLMDPRKLADQAVDLNLKLMRWRIMPEIKLEKIQNTKCLLLGAGTLGCYVARTLLGWGIRNITFVDSAKVSFSNPVRQPLFEFEDCLEGGQPKAECAARKLGKIYPGVNAKGISLNVPMPGHPVPAGSVDQVQKEVTALETLVDEHDVVYLLMDSRESRWLPTVLGAAKAKLVINAALGFDSYLVMRHGAPADDLSKKSAEQAVASLMPNTTRRWSDRLGCYFCNDIVAPSDSLTDRTLDQMCTVTRPGLAAIAGASAVELMVSVLQHEKGIYAPAWAEDSCKDEGAGGYAQGKDPASTVLGIVPHQLRGFLAQFNILRVVGEAYERCTGCSSSVVDAYRHQGFSMLLRAFNEDKFLEELTGLDKMYQEAEEMEAALDWDEGDEASL